MTQRIGAVYDRKQSYDWNFSQAPAPTNVAIAPLPGEFQFCGLPVHSPLGISAGPLLNGDWCLYYASLGFDVLTYKTVRSRQRDCYPLPNLQPVKCGPLTGDETEVPAVGEMTGSWAVSFGMPSQEPDFWRRDIEQTRALLGAKQLLSVSVVGTVDEGASMKDLAEDYARCARWATESGADVIECNLSCPNVSSCDGQLYQQPSDAASVAETVRAAIGSTPLVLKIGHTTNDDQLRTLLVATAPFTSAIAMTNSVAAQVRNTTNGDLHFAGAKRGICGAATFEPSLSQVSAAARIISEHQLSLELIGVGGASSAEHIKSYLAAGAHAVHMATAPMVDPLVGQKIRQAW